MARGVWVYAEESPPHDLLKVLYWKRHYDVSFVPDLLKGTELVDAIRRHHSKWQSDMMAASLARQFFDGADYVHGDLDSGTLFFIPVFEDERSKGGVIQWSQHERRELWKKIIETYNEERSRGGNWERRANRRVNNLLSEFPADTWTPFTSLKAHHIMTWILHMQALDERTGGELIEGFIRGVENPELCILMFRFPETEFQRLKELRRFIRRRNRTLEEVRLILSGLKEKFRFPILCCRVGDELITAVLNHNPWAPNKRPVEAVLSELSKKGVKCAIKVIRVKLRREPSKKRRMRPYWVTTEPLSEEEYYVGASVTEGGTGRAEWASDLLKDMVAWVSIEPKLNLAKSCEYFVVKYALKVMEKIPHKPGLTKPELKLDASPDIMFTVVEGYERFLNKVGKIMKTVVKSFSKSIFVWGLNRYRYKKAFISYQRLLILKQRLHIPVNIGMVITGAKFPFWRVLEILKKYPNNITMIPRSGKMVSLKEEDFRLMMDIIPIVNRIKRSVWENEIVPFSARSLVELNFELKRLSESVKVKVFPNDAKKIFEFAKKLDENHSDCSEEERRAVRYDAFKRLSDFAKG